MSALLEIEGLQEWLRDCPADSPQDVVSALYERAREWSGDHLHDDIALVAIRCRLLAAAGPAQASSENRRAAA